MEERIKCLQRNLNYILKGDVEIIYNPIKHYADLYYLYEGMVITTFSIAVEILNTETEENIKNFIIKKLEDDVIRKFI